VKIRLLAALAVVIAITLAVIGCGSPHLVTGKYRSWVGLYFVCIGPSSWPCVKGDVYRVSKATYDSVVVGRTYYNPWG
jgi:hypothetical protein